VLRALLVAILVASQGIPYLAGGLTLCVHADGGFCLESEVDDCCTHHREQVAAHECWGIPADELADCHSTIGQAPCDCTHLAIPDQPQLAGKVRHDQRIASYLNWRTPAVIRIAHEGGAGTALLSQASTAMAGSRHSAALSFLAPVMLRC
jgi:hypothetical protein